LPFFHKYNNIWYFPQSPVLQENQLHENITFPEKCISSSHKRALRHEKDTPIQKIKMNYFEARKKIKNESILK